MQKGELLGLPNSACLEIGLKPAGDLHHRARAAAVEANDERVFIPAPSHVFTPEPAVDQSAQVSPQAPRLDVVEPIEVDRLHETNGVRAPVTNSSAATAAGRVSKPV